MPSPSIASSPSTEPEIKPANALRVQHYRQLLVLSDRALECARQNNWQAAAQHFTDYTLAFDQLTASPPPSVAEAQACQELITQLLANENQLRQLIEPERDRLNLEMGTLKRQTSVLQAYSSPALTHER